MELRRSRQKRVGVLCGSRAGRGQQYLRTAELLGRELAARDAGLVYGAGGAGAMGAVSSAALRAGARVTGVIPHQLHERERADNACGEIFVVGSMHARKELMYELSDGFVALPGGFGTLDELMEVATWNQLGYHDKPVALVNVDGFFDPLVHMLDRMADEGFFTPAERSIVRVVPDPVAALDALGIPQAAVAAAAG